jgi:hypothetical protein
MRAAGHLDAAADLLAQYGAGTGGSSQDLLIARASLRIDQVQACIPKLLTIVCLIRHCLHADSGSDI